VCLTPPTQVDLLHLHQCQEVLPKLQALLEEGQAARSFARDQLMTDLKQLWEMPAMHVVPHHKCEAPGHRVLLPAVPQTSASASWPQTLHAEL
jgi:hypothetical protein